VKTKTMDELFERYAKALSLLKGSREYDYCFFCFVRGYTTAKRRARNQPTKRP
jgi:hypothetical protein